MKTFTRLALTENALAHALHIHKTPTYFLIDADGGIQELANLKG